MANLSRNGSFWYLTILIIILFFYGPTILLRLGVFDHLRELLVEHQNDVLQFMSAGDLSRLVCHQFERIEKVFLKILFSSAWSGTVFYCITILLQAAYESYVAMLACVITYVLPRLKMWVLFNIDRAILFHLSLTLLQVGIGRVAQYDFRADQPLGLHPGVHLVQPPRRKFRPGRRLPAVLW